MMRSAALAAFTLTLVVGVTPGPILYTESRPLMGTVFDVQIYASKEDTARDASRAAFEAMQSTDARLSNYNGDSELSVMNRQAAHSAFKASADLFAFVSECQRWYTITEGAFDPTVGPLVRAWGFFTRQPAKPSDLAVATARVRSGFDKVSIDQVARTISYAVDGVEFDSGGIGKGWAVDAAADALKRHGIASALVSAGGSTVLAIGAPAGRSAWRVAVRNPADAAAPFAYVELRNLSVSTSGGSERSVDVNGHRYPHLFDPRSGTPVETMCEASVVASTATASDALTKAAYVLSRVGVQRVFSRIRAHALRVEGECGRGALWTTAGGERVFLR